MLSTKLAKHDFCRVHLEVVITRGHQKWSQASQELPSTKLESDQTGGSTCVSHKASCFYYPLSFTAMPKHSSCPYTMLLSGR